MAPTSRNHLFLCSFFLFFLFLLGDGSAKGAIDALLGGHQALPGNPYFSGNKVNADDPRVFVLPATAR